MPTKLTDYHENLRALLGDFNSGGTYSFKAEQLSSALRSVVQLGLGPSGVLVVADSGDEPDAPPGALDPAPATPDARGYLIFKTALMMLGGNTPVGFKTRAMAVFITPAERELTLNYIRTTLRELETNGDPHGTGRAACFGVFQDLTNAVCWRRPYPDGCGDSPGLGGCQGDPPVVRTA